MHPTILTGLFKVATLAAAELDSELADCVVSELHEVVAALELLHPAIIQFEAAL